MFTFLCLDGLLGMCHRIDVCTVVYMPYTLYNIPDTAISYSIARWLCRGAGLSLCDDHKVALAELSARRACGARRRLYCTPI